MQAQEEYKSKSFTNSVKYLFQKEGFTAFYRGGVSNVLGNSLFRGAQFFIFEGVHSRFEPINLKNKHYEKIFTQVIPYCYGLEIRTVLAGILSGIGRSLVECPFEYVKVRRQVNVNYSFKSVYHGLFPLIMKNSLIISIGYCCIDIFRRNTNAWNSSCGIFMATGFSTIICNLVVWPIEIFTNVYSQKKEASLKV